MRQTLTTEIEVKLNQTEEKCAKQLVCVLVEHRVTKEIERLRIRCSPVNPDIAIIDACKQVLGITEQKGTALAIRPSDEVPALRVLGAWLLD